MSNLGRYQDTVTFAKKVGGPVNLKLLNMGAGALLLVLLNLAKKALSKIFSRRREERKESTMEYTVSSEGTDNEDLRFKVGDKFRVLESDGDAILIEKIGDSNNPYFVSAEFLKTISNYKG